MPKDTNNLMYITAGVIMVVSHLNVAAAAYTNYAVWVEQDPLNSDLFGPSCDTSISVAAVRGCVDLQHSDRYCIFVCWTCRQLTS